MRTYTTEHTVYSFEELSPAAQTAALDYLREKEDFFFLGEYMTEELSILLDKHKIRHEEEPRIYYSLNHCQGDGAMFEGTVYWKAWEVTVHQAGSYYHYNSKRFDIESVKTGKDAPEKVYAEFNELYVEICRDLERAGYDYMDDCTSDETLKGNIEANEYEFTKDGVIA